MAVLLPVKLLMEEHNKNMALNFQELLSRIMTVIEFFSIASFNGVAATSPVNGYI